MSIINKDVFVIDPTVRDIPNLGVAKVKNPEDDGDWETLEWELSSFVCEGEYERGLERILSQYLSHVGQAEQPAVWVSGFFGSGKSHLMRVLEYLWRDYELPSGRSARDLASLPDDIDAHLIELSAAGKRDGGLWSAAGTLSSGVSGSVRLAFLSVVFDAAKMPHQYQLSRFVLWLKNEGIYDAVVESVVKAGKDFNRELRNLYVSKVIAQALIDAGAEFGADLSSVSKALQASFPKVTDISNDDTLDVLEQVLRLQSSAYGKLPHTLIVLDEMQQYINNDGSKALKVQDLVEACSSRFGSQVLVVATGQSALAADPTLQKLIDRFAVTVPLSDADVETVVRKVVLKKKPDSIGAIKEALSGVSGEIDRHLDGTKLAATSADKNTLVTDYPLLPTRRRFWEPVLKAIDKAGKAGVLRTQLKIVHEAAKSVANKPLGTVIGADYLFRSEAASMLQSSVLLKEIDEFIRGLDDGTPEGELKSRACALVFLISQLPQEGFGDSGVRATAPIIADLLVEDLAKDGGTLRKLVPLALDELAEQGRLEKIGDEFRLQTEEGADWATDFNRRKATARNDAARMSQLRNQWLMGTVEDELQGLKLVQGASKTARKIETDWAEDEPLADGTAVKIWVRDEWDTTEAKVSQLAAKAGSDSPLVFVLLPKQDPERIRDTLSTVIAASEVIERRAEPQTNEGRQAKQGMQTRLKAGEASLEGLFAEVVSAARVLQGGGNELTTSSFRMGVETAAGHSLTRQFPKFSGPADHPSWPKVVGRARDGDPKALSFVDWSGEVPANPVCKEVLARTTAGGTKGSDIHKLLSDPPYGWPKDAVDGAILMLLINGNIRCERDGKPVGNVKGLPPTQITKATFFKEDEPPSTKERMAVRGVLSDANVQYVQGQEAQALSGLFARVRELASRAGGVPPLPSPPDTSHLDELSTLAGNEQFRAVATSSEQFRQDIKHWVTVGKIRDQRELDWQHLDRLLTHAGPSPETEGLHKQRAAIFDDRLLLFEPDPVKPLVKQVGDLLRSSLKSLAKEVGEMQTAETKQLKSSSEWEQLDKADSEEILRAVGLDAAYKLSVSSNEDLLASLDSTSLASWRERQQAISVKGSNARFAAAKMLEPKSVTLKPVSATIKTEIEVDKYLATLRKQLMLHVEADETVII